MKRKLHFAYYWLTVISLPIVMVIYAYMFMVRINVFGELVINFGGWYGALFWTGLVGGSWLLIDHWKYVKMTAPPVDERKMRRGGALDEDFHL